MTDYERLELVKTGLSAKVEQYLIIRDMRHLTIREIEERTGYGRYLIGQCRKICGKKREL